MEWSYQGQNGPEHWSRLCTDFKRAEEEASWQSPIPLNTAATRQEPKKEGTILFKKEKVKIKTDFFNHTVHLSPAEGNEASVVFQDKMYVLQDIHAHLPSEHTIDDHSFELEIHFVYRSADDQLLVCGVMGQSDYGAVSPLSGDLYDRFLKEDSLKKHYTLNLDLNVLIPDDSSFYHYSGSLTTPPTVGPVTWIIMKQPISLPTDFVKAFEKVIGQTNRPLQPVKERTVCFYH
ncbi:MAG: carbonic anhydrase family protein [Desemzia incerta]